MLVSSEMNKNINFTTYKKCAWVLHVQWHTQHIESTAYELWSGQVWKNLDFPAGYPTNFYYSLNSVRLHKGKTILLQRDIKIINCGLNHELYLIWDVFPWLANLLVKQLQLDTAQVEFRGENELYNSSLPNTKQFYLSKEGICSMMD